MHNVCGDRRPPSGRCLWGGHGVHPRPGPLGRRTVPMGEGFDSDGAKCAYGFPFNDTL